MTAGQACSNFSETLTEMTENPPSGAHRLPGREKTPSASWAWESECWEGKGRGEEFGVGGQRKLGRGCETRGSWGGSRARERGRKDT